LYKLIIGENQWQYKKKDTRLGTSGILRAWVSWTDKDGQQWACNYINIVSLDENDKCTKYMEWNVADVKEKERES